MTGTDRELTEEDQAYFQEFGREMDAIIDKYKARFEYVATPEGLAVEVIAPTKDGLSYGSTNLMSPLGIDGLKDIAAQVILYDTLSRMSADVSA